MSMCMCCEEREWWRSARIASCGTAMKMTTFDTMITGVDQSVVRSPLEFIVAEIDVSVMRKVEKHESRNTKHVVLRF